MSNSQENIAVFNMIFSKTLFLISGDLCERLGDSERTLDLAISAPEKEGLIKETLLNLQDIFGNTLLHIAARNEKKDMYDHLVRMGADAGIRNDDGLTPFLLTARFGIWGMFNHIWSNHLTVMIWRFGNVEQKATDVSEFDWKGSEAFSSVKDVENCLDTLIADNCIPTGEKSVGDSMFALVNEVVLYSSLRMAPEVNAASCSGAKNCIDELRQQLRILPPETYESLKRQLRDLRRKLAVVNEKRAEIIKTELQNQLSSKINKIIWPSPPESPANQDVAGHGGTDDDGMGDAMSGIRLITLFRPKDWFEHTKDKIEDVILRKWAQGFYLIHIGQSLIPYCIIMLLFGFMWWKRELHVLEHNFWWATNPAMTKLQSSNPSAALFRANPIRADISELEEKLGSTMYGSPPQQRGLLPDSLRSPDSRCGWWSIWHSASGILQAVLILYEVPTLIRLAYAQRRIRPSDLDEDEDLKISFEEIINFIYFNLESLFHMILCGLFVTIGASRVIAGDECNTGWIKTEKNATAMASLLLFLNFFVVCKPYEGIGMLVLIIYKFLVSDVFNFLVMYSTFFAAFLIALQTLHNANHVFLSWVDITDTIVPQIAALTDNMTYLQNGNVVVTNLLQDTAMAVDGCAQLKRTIQDTAFTLLEISFGDGLSDALQQSRRTDYECAGFQPDLLVGYVLVFWVFLTNVLVLNMLVAMMNYTFDLQSKIAHSVWILDISYRIMRYERVFPELHLRMQRPSSSVSFWKRKYWALLVSDLSLVIYCMPEVHLWGLGRRLLRSIGDGMSKLFPSNQEDVVGDDLHIKDAWEETIEASTRLARGPPGANQMPLPQVARKAAHFKISHLSERLADLARSREVIGEVAKWEDALQTAGIPVFNGRKEELRKALMTISLIYQLLVIKGRFDESRRVMEVRRVPDPAAAVVAERGDS